MKIKRRRKSTRFRGSHTHARGFKKKARGSGHRGGKGMAGTGKRGDAKKSLIINLFGNDYFGKDRTLRAGTKPIKLEAINFEQIALNPSTYSKDGINFDLKGYKILSDGNPGKWTITASAASQSAVEKIKKSGGEIILPQYKIKKEVKAEAKPEVKTEKKSKK
ncbi:MAG: uL15m family ribosomal protein [archaeon]|nr:uL15m family ribosomal protein [archaeon]